MKIIAFLLLVLLAKFSVAQNTSFRMNSKAFDNQNQVSEIPFEFNNGIIVLKASFNNGRNIYDFVLDSGAPTVITSDVLMTSSSRLLSEGDMKDFSSNTLTVSCYTTNGLLIGAKRFGSVELWSGEGVKEMPVLRNRADGGLIGANVMKGAIWMIDYQTSKIFVSDKLGSLPVAKATYQFPMRVNNNGSPIIKIKWPGRKDQTAIVDLGCNQSIIFPYRFLKDPIITQSMLKQESKRLTTGFLSQETTIPSDTLSFIDIGAMRIENVYALFPKNNDKIVIGNEFLKNFIAVFDFIHHQLLLTPTNQTTPVETLSALH